MVVNVLGGVQMRYRQSLALLWVGAVAVAGCGQSDAADSSAAAAQTTVTVAPTASTTTPTTTQPTTTAAPTTGASTVPESTVPDSTVPPPDTTPCADSQGPKTGKTYSVTGVESDDVLNIRELPGHTTAKIGALGPDTAGLRPTGGCALVGSAPWWELDIGDGAWINAKFLTPSS